MIICSSNGLCQDRNVRINDAREFVINGNYEAAITAYSILVERAKSSRTVSKGVNLQLLSEYATAQALAGYFDAAVVNIDRAYAMGRSSAVVINAMSLIAALMNYPEIAATLKGYAPNIITWYKGKLSETELIEQRKQLASINSDSYAKAFERANKLASSGMYFQSIILFQELIDLDKTRFAPYVGASGVWEKMGFNKYASTILERGILTMDARQKDKYSTMLEQHNSLLKNKKNIVILPSNRYRRMIFAGAGIVPSYYSITARYGIYLGSEFMLSEDFSYFYNKDAKKSNCGIGISAYYTWRALVGGMGVNYNITETQFSFKPSIGLKFISASGKSSFDIMLSLYIPTGKGAEIGTGLSIGKTFYFGHN